MGARLPNATMDGGGKAIRQNRYSRTGDREGQLPVGQAGILRGGHRGAKMRSALIFPRFTESTTMKNLFQPLLLLIAGATQKELARLCGAIPGRNP